MIFDVSLTRTFRENREIEKKITVRRRFFSERRSCFSGNVAFLGGQKNDIRKKMSLSPKENRVMFGGKYRYVRRKTGPCFDKALLPSGFLLLFYSKMEGCFYDIALIVNKLLKFFLVFASDSSFGPKKSILRELRIQNVKK